jgi:hypothetical protein
VTPASRSEQVELRAMIAEAFRETPGLADRCEDLGVDLFGQMRP